MDYKIFEVVLSAVLTNIFPVIGSVGAAIACSLLNTARRKVKVEKGVKAQQALDKVIVDVVAGISQTVISDIKNARRKLKPSDIENVRNLALSDTKMITANSVLKDVKSVVDDVDDYILHEVEAKVGEQKLIKMEAENGLAKNK